MPLTGRQKSTLRALAHHLDPVVAIGKEGLGPGLLKQIDEALERHELIKVKVQRECPTALSELSPTVEQETRSTLAQTIGRVLVLYRRRREKPTIVLPSSKGAAS